MKQFGGVNVAKGYAKQFYTSNQWENTRKAYLISQHYICERCGGYANMVHHKKHINPNNINDVMITLCFDNLEALCWGCHNKEHKHKEKNRNYKFDENGNII